MRDGLFRCMIILIVFACSRTEVYYLVSFFSIELEFPKESCRSILEPIEELGDEDGFFSLPTSSRYTLSEFLYRTILFLCTIYLCTISEFFDECLHITRLYMSEYSDARLYSLDYIFHEKLFFTLAPEGKGSERIVMSYE